MLAGIAAYVKRVRPTVKVIGVEAADAAGMTESLRAGEVVTLGSVGLFADGAAVKTIGKETFRVCSKLVDDMVTVSTDQICNAIKLAYNDARVILEPAGALAVAAAVTTLILLVLCVGFCRIFRSSPPKSKFGGDSASNDNVSSETLEGTDANNESNNDDDAAASARKRKKSKKIE